MTDAVIEAPKLKSEDAMDRIQVKKDPQREKMALMATRQVATAVQRATANATLIHLLAVLYVSNEFATPSPKMFLIWFCTS